MLAFVNMINETFKETELWGLTSHSRFVIQAKDNWKAEWYITVANIGTNDYYFEYLMPKDKQPWEHARIRGEANSLEEAKKYLLIAMHESEGWKENAELDNWL